MNSAELIGLQVRPLFGSGDFQLFDSFKLRLGRIALYQLAGISMRLGIKELDRING